MPRNIYVRPLLVNSFNMWDERNYAGHLYPTENWEITWTWSSYL